MKKLIAGLLIGLVVGLSIGYGVSGKSNSKTPTPVSNPPTIAELLSLVNAERAWNHVPPLREDARLDASAQFKASDEVSRNYFGHTDQATGKNNGLDAANQLTGTTCMLVSENLTKNNPGANTSDQAVNSWISSPAHHAAMIDVKYTLTGFGIAGNQVVEHFCQQP